MDLTGLRLKTNREHSKTAIESLKEALGVIKEVKEHDFESSSVVVYAKDFKTEAGFAYAMGALGKHFKDFDDIVVRYSKPKNDETGEIMVCFEVLKSKAKIFLKWMKEHNEPIYFVVASNKEIKECVKFFKSLAVKDDDGESISYFTESMKSDFDPTQNKIYVDIRLYDEVPTMEWNYVGKMYECDKTFGMVKESIKEILK